jgi:hypothetical protein
MGGLFKFMSQIIMGGLFKLGLGISDSFQFMLFQLVLLKLSAEQKTVKLLWVAYLYCYGWPIYNNQQSH